MELQRIEAVEWAGGLAFRLRFADGTAGLVDLGGELPAGSHARAAMEADAGAVRIAPRGRALVWVGADGDEVDLDAETLRGLCEASRAAAE